MQQIIECVPNFSEGANKQILNQLADAIKNVPGVKLLNVDPGVATNRTVFTFVGAPESVIEAAFQAIKLAGQIIDMSKHKGEHPRMGATDVCPLIPISGISMEETVEYAKKLAKRVGEETDIPVYLYEEAATSPRRKNLASIREGEYEGLAKKIVTEEWKPDFGKPVFNARAGATVIGARDFLVAYNINLNSTSTRIANAIAFDVREQGRVKRKGHPITGEPELDAHGEMIRIPGSLKSVKAIGWYIDEYKQAQISMNLTNLNITSVHKAFDEVAERARDRGVRVTGSEIVGMVPKKVLTDAGKHYLTKQKRSLGVSEEELIRIAIMTLGLDDIAPFKPEERIIEYMLEASDDKSRLQRMNLVEFAQEAASESPAPGGGSIAAYVGALGVALGNMVANLSANKRGWEDQFDFFSTFAEKGQNIQTRLLKLVDEDTAAFTTVMQAFALPKSTDEEKEKRREAIEQANLYASEVPLRTMKTAHEAWPLLKEMVNRGNPNSITDGAVGALCLRTAIYAAFMNLKVNAGGMDNAQAKEMIAEGEKLLQTAFDNEKELAGIAMNKLS